MHRRKSALLAILALSLTGRAWVPARLVGRRGFDLLLVGVGLALTAALGAVPAQAAGPPVAGQLPSGTLRPGVTPDPQTCAKVHQAGLDAPRVPSAAVSAAVAARGAKLITCPLPSTVGPGPITNAVEPRVQCTGEQSRINRSSSCNSQLRTLILFVQVEGGGQVILGTLDFSVRNQVILDGRNATWTDTITFVAIKSSGDLRLRDTTVTATAVCGFGCTVRLPSIIVSRPFFPGLAPQVQDTATFDPTLAGAGDKVFTNDRWEYFFSNPAATPPNTQTGMIWSGPHRCDSTLVGLNPGCAYSSELPTHRVTGEPGDQYVRHVQLSIDAGLTNFLTRTTDENLQARNNDIACPPSIPRLGLDCDEYPFASTRQGAALFGPSGRKQMQVRDRNNPDANFLCMIPAALAPVRQRGDSSGFNVCLIEASDNRSGGAKLGNFYYDNRVIDGDSFRVVAR